MKGLRFIMRKVSKLPLSFSNSYPMQWTIQQFNQARRKCIICCLLCCHIYLGPMGSNSCRNNWMLVYFYFLNCFLNFFYTFIVNLYFLLYWQVHICHQPFDMRAFHYPHPMPNTGWLYMYYYTVQDVHEVETSTIS